MRLYRRLIFAVVLLAFSAGCSGYRTALVPGVYDPAMPADPDSPVVEVGMEVRVLFRSGEDQRGEVVQLGEQSLVLGRVGNYGFQKTEILYVDIDEIEVESAPKWAAIGLGVVGTTMVVVGGVIMLIFLTADFEEGLN